MTLGELIKVVDGKESVCLRIDDKYYMITKDYYNILRPEIWNLDVAKLMASTVDGDVCLDISLEAPVAAVTSIKMATVHH